MMLHNISYTIDRKSIRSGNPSVLETVVEESDKSESDQHYLELVKLIDYVLSEIN